jgi:hypothetical protein
MILAARAARALVVGGVLRIVSGGQTGADRAALDVALALGLECGGWVPLGRRAEDGVIPAHYPNLIETRSSDPAERTVRNVRDSDATLLITRGPPAGGSAATLEAARRLGKPILHIDLSRQKTHAAASEVARWIEELAPRAMNVAGPRHSEDASIYALTKLVLTAALSRHLEKI